MSARLHLVSPTRETRRDGSAISEETISVVLADDHDSIRRRIRDVLDADSLINVICDTRDVGTATRLVHDALPHVLVLDVGMLGETAPSKIRALRSASPATQLVALTMEARAGVARTVLRAGAIGYVLKEHADPEICTAVRCARAGTQFVTPRLAVLVQQLSDAETDADGLTPSELTVLRLIALGHTNVEISRRLGMAVEAVDDHRSRLLHKLGLQTRADLVSYAIRRGMLRR